MLLCAGGFLLGRFGVPGQGYLAPPTASSHARRVRVLWEAWRILEQRFYSPTALDPQVMTYGAIHGMVAGLGDPFVSFVEPAAHRLEIDSLKGEFGGIGASLVLMQAYPTFIEVYVSSPAESAGLQVGDRLLAVDGHSVSGLPLEQIALLIRGSLDSPVRLDVERATGQRLSVSIVRQRVEMPSLGWQTLSDGIGYVGIHFFSARTGEELDKAIQELQRQRVAALVLDLRGNAGGVTGGAIDVLRHLLGHGIAYRELRRGAHEQRHAIPFDEALVDWPLALLLDRQTASAAEMVAAAIRDYDRGVLVGQHTFGKGSVQGMYPLSDGSSLHVTISRWLSPAGYTIDGVGLEPDIAVDLSGIVATDDASLRRAVDYLHQKIGRASENGIAPLISRYPGKVMV